MIGISDLEVEQFADVFRGRADIFGGTEGISIKQPATLAVYRAHLEGRRSIGIYPLLADGTIWFAAIDFDRKIDKQTGRERSPAEIDQLALGDAEAVAAVLGDLGLNNGVYLERSKSKGAHLWVFFTAPVPAADVRRILQYAYDTAVGRRPSDPAVEIFPKQDRLSERNPFGNFINLPFLDARKPGQTRRVLLTRTLHEPMALDEFLELVTGDFRFDAAGLPLVVAALPATATPEPERTFIPLKERQARFYPCTQPMLIHGLPEGTGRNNFAFLLSKRIREGGFTGDDGWVQLQAWNLYNVPPLDQAELRRTWESSEHRTSMDCKNDLVLQFCKTSCPIHPSNKEVEVSRIRKIQMEPPRYQVTVNSLDVLVTPAVLWNYPLFKRAVWDQTTVHLVLAKMKQEKWDELLRDLSPSIENAETPDDASVAGVVWQHVRQYLEARYDEGEAPADDPSQSSKPFEDSEWVYFRSVWLDSYLTQHHAPKLKPGELWSVIKAKGGRSAVRRLQNANTRFWALPLASLTDGQNE